MGTAKRPPLPIPGGSGSSGAAGVGSSISARKTSGPASATSASSASASAAPSTNPSAVTPATPGQFPPIPSATAGPSTFASSTGRRRPSETMSAASAHNSPGSDDEQRRRAELSRLVLVVRQQPERARLCSYKEENDTVDRRPVDPPPVVEMTTTSGEIPEHLDPTSFFIRATLVAAEPSPPNAADLAPGEVYAAIKTPTGGEPTSGEAIQTPERLKHLDGTPAALCIFPKLSVRLPGIFRLKFALYETADEGLAEITHTVSDTFEVFSPKLFKGMHESTPLTRHLANQGLKVKLRTDPNGGKGSNRRRASVASFHAPGRPEPGSPASAGPPRAGPSHSHHGSGPASAPPHGQHPPRSLVWYGYPQGFPQDFERSPGPDEPARKVRRTRDWRSGRDDGLFDVSHFSSRMMNLTAPSPSSDLSEFSLGRSGSRPTSAPSPPHFRWDHPRDGEDTGPPHPHAAPQPMSAGPHSQPRRHFSDSRPQEHGYVRERPRDFGRDDVSRESPRERELAAREWEWERDARERDMARERALRLERDMRARDPRDQHRDPRELQRDPRDPRDHRDYRGHYGHPLPHPGPPHHYPYPPSPSQSQGPPPGHPHGLPHPHPHSQPHSRSHSQSQPPLPPVPGHSPSEFALPRLPPIMPGDPMNPLAPPPHEPYAPGYIHHGPSRHPSQSPQTPQSNTAPHPPYPVHPQHPGHPGHPSSGPPSNPTGGPPGHGSAPHPAPPHMTASPPTLPPIREHSPRHRPYEREPRR